MRRPAVMALGEDEHMTCLCSWHFVQDLPDYFSKVVLLFLASPYLAAYGRHCSGSLLCVFGCSAEFRAVEDLGVGEANVPLRIVIG